MFLVQTVLDIGVFSGGLALPDGMTYPGYVYRGAYPLVFTALLAGLFAIFTHRMIARDRFLRILLFVWLGQNLFLVMTAALRLSHYVDVYALTLLRVAAFIWMGLVVVGLVLTFIQISQSRSIDWLVRCNLISLGATLYICSFINFSHLIAVYNYENRSKYEWFDEDYLCELREQALPTIITLEGRGTPINCVEWPRPTYQPIEDWREWSLRRWLLGHRIDAALFQRKVDEPVEHGP